MDKKKLAKMFVESFKTDIKEVELSGQLKGSGGTVEAIGHGEVIFGNYASYADMSEIFAMFLSVGRTFVSTEPTPVILESG